ncbi:MAG TPA: bacillithiol biosynthesis cysteine-adding enzyme BshC [Flavobacterium sp.]|jgi:bacillithiol biosynthesis cysteine-adding enzyme BshC
MPTDCISYQSSGYFTPLMNDYLDQVHDLKPLYNRFPTLKNFELQIEEKQGNYTKAHREILVTALQKQYQNVNASPSTKASINLLQSENTFTITTGHQLNLFTGPLYFLYKIISTLNLAKELKAQYPTYNFIPTYWMATEDHDFEEINYFNFRGKKLRWNRESSGAVGRLSTEGLDQVLEIFSLELGSGTNAETIKKLFADTYLKHDNLADATRFLANELFGNEGLVILDADDTGLKRLFSPHIKQELLEQISYTEVSETAQHLKAYNIQVNPREINLFYLTDKLRERIIFQNDTYYINNTQQKFSEAEILSELEQFPERFSPNVIMRPLYQEVILPNLCYIGGGGELAYWLELKGFFDAVDVTFPILLLRNSVLIASEKQAKKADRLDLSWADLFQRQTDLVNKKIKDMSEFPIDLSSHKLILQKQFDDLHQIASKTDKSFEGAVRAQEARQIKGLENLEKRLLRAQKKKHSDELARITDLQNELFPYHSLQERHANFSEFYIDNGNKLIEQLQKKLNPLDNEFMILVL